MTATEGRPPAGGGQSPRNAAPRENRRLDEWSARITAVLTHFLRCFSAHWLALTNVFLGLYIGLPLLSPILYQAGNSRGGALLQMLYRPFCHQRPERSFFLFGEQVIYSTGDLTTRLGVGTVPYRYVGAPGIGFRIAVCERDVAIYGTMFLAGLLFALVRKRLRPLTGRQFLALILPMAVDGLGQLVGLWSSTWISRVITGALFGLASIWLVYPYLQEGLSQVYREMSASLSAPKEAHGSRSG